MTSSDPVPSDPELPATPLLLGDGADGMLRAALAGLGEVRRWWRSQTRHLPGRHIVVRYGVEVGWPDGTSTVETLVAEQSVLDEAPAGVTVLQTPAGDDVWVWRYPFDPYLPGLGPAAHPAAVRELLDRLGVPPGGVRVVPRAYRPTRRAVLEVSRPAGPPGPRRWFIKVVPPRRTRRIHDVHLAVAASVRAPLPLAADLDAGTLVLAEVPGRDLRAVLTDRSASLPDAAGIVEVQQRLAAVRTGLTRPPARPFGVRRGATSAVRLLPQQRGLVDAIAEVADAAADATDPVVTIHGDLHEAQLVLGDDGVLGLVDLDGTGPGAVLDDAATVLAHALLVSRWHPPTAGRSDAFAGAYLGAVAALVDPDRVRRRAAGVLLGLAAGSFAAGEEGWQAEALGRLGLAADLAGVRPR